MEIKKSPKADLENKRGLFLEIGLVVALVLVIGAFAVTPKEHRIEKVDLGYAPVEVEIVEVTREDQKPPEAPKKVDMAVVSDMLEVVTNDTKIETEIDFAEFDVNQAIEVAPVQTEEVFEEEIFIVVEEKASFMGGDEGTFRNWVQQRVKYPAIAQENGIQGKVTISFVVNTDGSVSSPAISGQKVYELINMLKEKQASGVQITIVTWTPDSYGFGDAAYWMQLHEDMCKAGFYIKTVEESCERFAVIDQEVVWYGNINLLAKTKVDDSIMRVLSNEIAGELMEITFGDNS